MADNDVSFDFITYEKKPFTPASRRFSRLGLFFEGLVKVPLFRCQHCGECILSHTAYICSQRCPKRLRNGPCGGTGQGGTCEVYPERKCTWYRIYHRSRFLGRLVFLKDIEKAHNWGLEKTSAWLNVFSGRIQAPTFFAGKKEKKP